MRGRDLTLERLKLAWNGGKVLQGQLGTLFMETYGRQTRKTKLALLTYIYGEMDDLHHGELLDFWESGQNVAPVDELTRRTVGVR